MVEGYAGRGAWGVVVSPFRPLEKTPALVGREYIPTPSGEADPVLWLKAM